ncbi:MAG: cyclic nucleotide-binding domain-containing protein [Deltaproteobacteria bacterium]|nr:cyclic nucleotide-binding domain-containing protein [Deltaproteobacteria bacterium]
MTTLPEFFRTVPLFADCDTERLAALARIAQPMTAAPQEVVIREGEIGDALYIVQDGACAVTTRLGSSAQIELLTVLTAGDIFGEIGLLVSQPRSATVTALDLVELLRLDAEPLHRLLAEDAAFGVMLYRRLGGLAAERLHRLTEHLRRIAARGAVAANETRQVQAEIEAVMAREVAAPVAVLKGAADFLQDGGVTPARRGEFLRTMATQAEHLARVLADLHAVWTLRYHPPALVKQSVPLPALFQAAWESVEAELGARAPRLATHFPADLPTIPVEPEKFRTAVVHLLRAVLQRTCGGTINVAACRDGDLLRLAMTLRDADEGKDGNAQPRAEASTITEEEAASRFGVGWMVARKLVEAHGGSLSAARDGPRELRVSVTVPL